MPAIGFKGKSHIYAHHLTVPHRPLIPDPGKSVQKRLFDPVFDSQFDSDLEKKFAFYVDQHEAVSLDNGRERGRFKILFREESFAEVLA